MSEFPEVPDDEAFWDEICDDIAALQDIRLPTDDSGLRAPATCTSAPQGTVATTDDKRLARLVRNRESAQLSRLRRKQHADELEARCRVLQAANSDLQGLVCSPQC